MECIITHCGYSWICLFTRYSTLDAAETNKRSKRDVCRLVEQKYDNTESVARWVGLVWSCLSRRRLTTQLCRLWEPRRERRREYTTSRRPAIGVATGRRNGRRHERSYSDSLVTLSSTVTRPATNWMCCSTLRCYSINQ